MKKINLKKIHQVVLVAVIVYLGIRIYGVHKEVSKIEKIIESGQLKCKNPQTK